MPFYVDLVNLDRFLSTLDEELREINRLEGIVEKQRALSSGMPNDEAIILARSRFIKKERERIQSRKTYLLKAQELFPSAEKKTKSSLESAILELQQLNQ